MSAYSAIFEKRLFTIRRKGATSARDPLGRPTAAFGDVATVDGILQPTGTLEGEAFVVDRFRSIMPVGTDLRAADQVVARGDVYTVEGTPFEASPPGMRSAGIVTAVLRYVGPVTS